MASVIQIANFGAVPPSTTRSSDTNTEVLTKLLT
jgi:hypothetical protein